MATILLAWNPSRYPWGNLSDELKRIRRRGKATVTWSVGTSRKPRDQDRAFMIRLGDDLRGIVASGWITSSEPFEDRHWDQDRARSGQTALYVDLVLDYLSEQPVVPWATLQRRPLNVFRWGIQMSGISVPEPAASALEREWERQIPRVASGSETTVGNFLEGRRHEVTLKQVERNPAARAACIAYHGLACACCGMTFGATYGDDAANLIVVHHLEPLANAPGRRRVDPIRDLRPVCANCHDVLHLRTPPLSLEDVRARVRQPRESRRNSRLKPKLEKGRP